MGKIIQSYMTRSWDGTRRWLGRTADGKEMFHRVNGPAIEREDGSKYWYFMGVLCRPEPSGTIEDVLVTEVLDPWYYNDGSLDRPGWSAPDNYDFEAR
jgi:hypothetical protein